MAGPRQDTLHEQKIMSNFLSYATLIILDGMNYDIWSRSFMMYIVGNDKKYILVDDKPSEKMDQ